MWLHSVCKVLPNSKIFILLSWRNCWGFSLILIMWTLGKLCNRRLYWSLHWSKIFPRPLWYQVCTFRPQANPGSWWRAVRLAAPSGRTPRQQSRQRQAPDPLHRTWGTRYDTAKIVESILDLQTYVYISVSSTSEATESISAMFDSGAYIKCEPFCLAGYCNCYLLHATFLVGIFFDSEVGGDMSLLNFGRFKALHSKIYNSWSVSFFEPHINEDLCNIFPRKYLK